MRHSRLSWTSIFGLRVMAYRVEAKNATGWLL